MAASPTIRLHIHGARIRQFMDICMEMGVAFYYSGKQGIVRAETRRENLARELEIEAKALELKYRKSYYE